MTAASRILLAAIVLSVPRAPRAQPHRPDADVGAEALFREGRRLVKDGHLVEGCDKLEASERLADSVGTLLNLADCREKNAQLATAWATFLRAATAARAAGDSTREGEARTRARGLEPRLSYLTISVPAASAVEGLAIERDGIPVDAALWNQGVPIDAGSYEIRGRAPGHEPWTTRVDLKDGQKASVEVPRFKRIAELSAAVAPKATAAVPAVEAESDDEPATPARTRVLTPMREIAIGAAAVGLVGIAGGIKYGLSANDQQHQANALCPERTCSDPHALGLNTSARHDALASDILFGVGGAAIAGGVALWLLGAPAHVTATASADRVEIAVAGRF